MFVFRFQKTLQAVAVLLRDTTSHEMNYMRLLKLLYIADRESLRETGAPITGDQAVAMKRGPVLSRLLDLIRGQDVNYPEWSNFISRDDYQIRLVCDPGNGLLSKYEVAKIKEVAERYRSQDEWAMVEVTHQFGEWRKNDPGESSKPIPLCDILEAVGRPQDLERIEKDARADAFFTSLFGE